MLKFFRRLRQTLLDGGGLKKPASPLGRYLVYALGEILLVMIGILLALQVNNWNEQKKLSEREAVYLTRLQEDVSTMMDFYGKSAFMAGQIQEAHHALDFIESCGEKKGPEAAFSQTLITHQVLRSFPQNRSTYDEMVSSGAFAGLENGALKDAVSTLFNWLEGGNRSVDYFREEVGRASAAINNYVSFSYGSDNQLMVSYTPEDLCRNASFNNAIVEVIDAREDWLFIYQNIFKSLENVHSILETERAR